VSASDPATAPALTDARLYAEAGIPCALRRGSRSTRSQRQAADENLALDDLKRATCGGVGAVDLLALSRAYARRTSYDILSA